MLRLLDRTYRRIATGFAFVCLFGGGGLLAVTVLPLVALTPGAGREPAQRIISATFRLYLWMLQGLRLIRLEIDGRDQLSLCRGTVIVANHPSLLDIVMLMALVPRAQCIVKHQLWNHLLLGGLVRRAGYIRNDLDGEAMIAACRASLNDGDNLIIFPEGTRGRPGDPRRWQRGFANVATLTGAPVQLVVITCDPPTLMKGDPWWMIPEKRPIFGVKVGHCIDTTTFLTMRKRSLASRKMTEQVVLYYMEQLAHA